MRVIPQQNLAFFSFSERVGADFTKKRLNSARDLVMYVLGAVAIGYSIEWELTE